MAQSPGRSLDDLLDEITSWPVGMPVRAMERVLAMGEAAVPDVAEALVRWRDDEARDLLWPVVLLGQSRAPAAVEPLVRQLRRTDLDLLTQAACEGLAVVGAPAVPALCEVVRTGDALQRLYGYAALGWIPDERAYAALVEALRRDRELADVLAMALADQGRRDAIPLLYEAYRTCEPWQRLEFEDAIRDLHWGRRQAPPSSQDWRFRYRRLPALGYWIRPAWIVVAALAHQSEEARRLREEKPGRALEEIVAEPPPDEGRVKTCETCGAAVEYPTGIPVCPETALGVVLYQIATLEAAREEGVEDLFDLLDDLDDDERDHLERNPATSDLQRREDELTEIALARQTCRWLVEQGVETMGPAIALLLAKTAWVADRYGDPDGLLRRAGPGPVRRKKVGRNDPCPCGSGRKYKRCCGKT